MFQEFFEFINTNHENIKFTFETEVNGILPFLDIFISMKSSSFDTTTYYKKTYTGILTNFTSFTSMKHKIGHVKTLVDRAFKINSSYTNLHNNLLTIKDNLQRNGFPLLFVDKIIRNYLDGKFSNTEPQDSANKIPPRYYKLPFLGDASILLKNRLSKLVSRCCDNAKVKLIFVPIKLNSFFSLKDVPRASLKSSVVYRFTCASCSASYVGETSRHLTTRIKEHLETDKN